MNQYILMVTKHDYVSCFERKSLINYMVDTFKDSKYYEIDIEKLREIKPKLVIE